MLSFQFAGCLLEGRLERCLQPPFEPERGFGTRERGVLRLHTFPAFVVPVTLLHILFSLSQNCCADFMTLPTYSRWLKRACKKSTHASAVTRVSR